MTDKERLRLRTLIKYSGYKLNVLSYKIGLSRTTLWSRLSGKSEFSSTEIDDLCRVLHMTRAQRRFIFGEDSGKNVIPKRQS